MAYFNSLLHTLIISLPALNLDILLLIFIFVLFSTDYLFKKITATVLAFKVTIYTFDFVAFAWCHHKKKIQTHKRFTRMLIKSYL